MHIIGYSNYTYIIVLIIYTVVPRYPQGGGTQDHPLPPTDTKIQGCSSPWCSIYIQPMHTLPYTLNHLKITYNT